MYIRSCVCIACTDLIVKPIKTIYMSKYQVSDTWWIIDHHYHFRLKVKNTVSYNSRVVSRFLYIKVLCEFFYMNRLKAQKKLNLIFSIAIDKENDNKIYIDTHALSSFNHMFHLSLFLFSKFNYFSRFFSLSFIRI